MLSRFVRDDADQTRKHFFFGSLLILLSLAIGTSLIGYSWQSHSVLGSQTIAQGMQIETGGSLSTGSTDIPIDDGGIHIDAGSDNGAGGNGDTQIIDQPNPTAPSIQVNPTTVPRETPIPAVSQPSPTPIVVGSVPELIENAGPQTEIVIKNEDNTLIVSTTADPNQVAVVEQGESLSGENPSVQSSGTTDDPVIETVLTYDPVTKKYIDVPAFYTGTDNESGASSSISNTQTSTTARALTVISNSVQKVFSAETYFPSDSQEQRNVVNLQLSSNHMYEWLSKYQFQVWPIGSSHLAIYRNGITTLTRYPIALGLSRQSVRLLTENGYKQLLHYPDSIWQAISDRGIVAEDSHDEPIILTYENNKLLYKIQGASRQLMFAFIPTSVCEFVVVSAEDQEVLSIKPCGTKDAILEALSITIN